MLKLILRRKILVTLVTVLIIILGGYSLTKLDQVLLPEVEFDQAYAIVSAGDMSAAEVERSITNPLEQRIQGVDGVEDIDSTTAIGQSSIYIMIESGRGHEVSQEVTSIVQSTTADIAGITDVVTDQVGTTQNYEFYMDISNGDMDKMTEFAEDILEPRLENLAEVDNVSLMGNQSYEMAVEFDREAVNDNALDISKVTSVIQQTNTEATLGELSAEQNEPSLRWQTKSQSVEDVEHIQIPTQTGFIDLQEIANVTLKPLASSSYVWKNGTKDFIFIQIGRSANTTQIEMAESVRTEVNDIREEGLISGFELNEMVAQADYIQDSIDGISSNILVGGILAIVILLLFLRNLRATVIIGVSIPTSILLTFITMWILDYSFNILTLIGLGLGIGMMVDSAIVILESIYRKKEEGLNSVTAVIHGTKEVATAVIASMLTTIAVFLPIGIMGGEVGQFMILLSVVVATTLISSVIVAFTLIPTLAEKFLKLPKKKKRNDSTIVNSYGNFVAWIVKQKRNSFSVVFIFFLLFVGSVFLVPKIPMNIMPDMLNRYSELLVDVESGLTVEEREELTNKINETLIEIDDVESNHLIDESGSFYTFINMTKGEDITREQEEVNEDILQSLRNLSEDTPIKSVQSMMSVSTGYPVQVQISGEDFEQLQILGEDFSKELEQIHGIEEVSNSIERTSVEKVVELKENAMEDAGLSENQIRQFIQQVFLDMPIGEVTVSEESIPLNLKWGKKTTTEDALLGLKVPTQNGEEPLSTFIELQSVQVPNEISHHNGERYITISADTSDTDLGSVNREVQQLIDNIESPLGYTISVAGDLEEQQELMQDMILILAISIFLVYLVMAVQFNHLSHPLIVMSVIPMTIVGVIAGLYITQQELSVMSGMGIIMLIGIVLNNAILLVDRANQLRKKGYTLIESISEAGKNRIRPIFMTTLTTAGGMLPLALAGGISGNYQAPMAIAIISGLLFATLITLVLIPAVYQISHIIGNGFQRVFKKKKSTRLDDLAG
ncbi:efflux RND transporter permease subunit [Virgibacillus salinus]|uniref:Hydrophobic/amphiphilic exporter-1, HAE1 family n=1 Tax=Virgibacillus salinus TaxID=553311 RepID=A0A1H1EMH7_9BACI|nr:efflux RND transporter permease subunit [Virgibacillus salinus]SDQ89947.1 hydrophobic/amphiphilic exporter-1, HAE1 family [Virgibacillus salinus]